MDKVLLYFSLKYNGEWSKIYDALESKEKISVEDLETVEDKIDCKYLTILNPLYPNTLKNSNKPPFVIFYKGEIDLLVNYRRAISFIVDEPMDEYSKTQFEKIKKSLTNENKTFLVNEIENQKHYSITDKNKTISLVNGLEKAKHTKGLTISESYEGNEKQDVFFQRIAFNLPIGIIVINISRTGTNMDLINSAIADNKELFALPQGNIDQAKYGNNFLIKQGAKLIEYPSDILCEI